MIAVAGMSGLECPIAVAAHRPERYAVLVGKDVSQTASPTDVISVLESPQGQRRNVRTRFALVLNQCDTPARLIAGRACAAMARYPCVLTALLKDPSLVELWRKEPC